MNELIGKWIAGGYHVYEFFGNGEFQTYALSSPEKKMKGDYEVRGNLVSLSLYGMGSANVNKFDVEGDTLYLYPPDGGSPIEFKRN